MKKKHVHHAIICSVFKKHFFFIFLVLIILPMNSYMTSYTFDENGTRYKLVQTNKGHYNWLFFPGGPGADSSYFLPLIESLQLPGKTWLIDLPNSGSNIQNLDESFTYDSWLECVVSAVKKFENPVYVGHSFGGMLALLLPELESMLNGLIILGSAPIIGRDLEEVKNMLSARNISPNSEAIMRFIADQTDENFRNVLFHQAPGHFPPQSLSEGRKLFNTLPFNFKAMLGLFGKGQTYTSQWVPQHLPTLIMGGTEDCINPIALFCKDSRFKRNNIKLVIIEGSGHFLWLENLAIIKQAFNDYITLKLN